MNNLIFYGAIGLVIVTGAYFIGNAHGYERAGKVHARTIKRLEDKIVRIEHEAYEAALESAVKMRNASAEYQLLKEEYEKKQAVKVRTVQKIVEKPVYNNTCISDDGLHELNRSIQGN